MENEKMLQELGKILGIDGRIGNTSKIVTWAEVFTEIGRLIERANPPVKNDPFPPLNPLNPFGGIGTTTTAPHHFHDGMICYKNPCVWC
jgi:hypothetical protein